MRVLRAEGRLLRLLAVAFALCAASSAVFAQHTRRAHAHEDEEFGPNVRAYLGYLRNEQEGVDARASRQVGAGAGVGGAAGCCGGFTAPFVMSALTNVLLLMFMTWFWIIVAACVRNSETS